MKKGVPENEDERREELKSFLDREELELTQVNFTYLKKSIKECFEEE